MGARLSEPVEVRLQPDGHGGWIAAAGYRVGAKARSKGARGTTAPEALRRLSAVFVHGGHAGKRYEVTGYAELAGRFARQRRLSGPESRLEPLPGMVAP